MTPVKTTQFAPAVGILCPSGHLVSQPAAWGILRGVAMLIKESDERRFWSKARKQNDDQCWMWTGAHSERYGQFGLCNNGTGKTYRAHRIAWELTNGAIPNGLYVCHHCDVPLCVNPGHLFLGTQTDNLQDARKKGRMRKKVTKEMESLIRSMWIFRVVTHKMLGKKFGLSVATIKCVLQEN